MAKTEKPNILVIWGDDIGISNLSCYSHGLMGYRTPNIDRIAKEGMMFTDSYGEQSCTAGRSSFITGQSVYRTGLSKVGIPGAPIGMSEKLVTIAACLKNQGYATGQFGKNHLGDLNDMLPTNHGFDEFFGNLYHLNAEEEPEMDDYPNEKDFPNFRDRFGPRGVIHSWATDKDDPTEEPRWGKVGKQRVDRHRSAHEKAHGNVRRRIYCGGQGLHQAPERRGQALLRLAQHHAHASLHPSEAREQRTGGTLAVALPRHDDRPRQERRPGARLSRRARHRGRHLRHVFDRQRPAHEHVAGRRHDAVPQREEHQLGGRLPRADGRALAGQDQAGSDLERDRPASRLVPDLPRDGRRSGRRREAEERLSGDRPHLQEPHRRLQSSALPHRRGEGEPAQVLHVFERRRRRAGLALRQLEDGVHGAALPRHVTDLGRAVHPAQSTEDLQSAHRPLRAGGSDVQHLLRVVHSPHLPVVRRAGGCRRMGGDLQGLPAGSEAQHLHPRRRVEDDARNRLRECTEPGIRLRAAGSFWPVARGARR